MYKNELAIVSIKPNLAYGSLGRKPDIPADSRITYLFGLLHFEKQKEVGEMTWAQRRKMGQSRMRIANWWYSRKEHSIAVKCYKKALQYYNNIPTNQVTTYPPMQHCAGIIHRGIFCDKCKAKMRFKQL